MDIGTTLDDQASGAGASGAAERPLQILIVDDSSAIRTLMTDKLTEIGSSFGGADIATAANGVEAVEAAAASPYDVIFMDVEMPDMNGLDAVRRIREFSSARVAMLSSLCSAEDHLEGRKAGCNHYLTKPPNDVDIRVVLRLASISRA